MDGKHTITINHELRISFPDGFHVMDAEERKTLRMLVEGDGECLADPERHMVVSIGYKQPPKLALMLLNVRDLAKKTEADICKPMQQYGYRLAGFFERIVGGEKANGFAYEYEAQGTGMYAESLVLKRGKTVYYFHCYMRKELKTESAGIWEEMTRDILFSR